MPDLEQARRMLRMAHKDLETVSVAVDLAAIADEIFGFHVQQAAEKALKAWLAALDRPYPFRHDLGELLHLLTQAGEDVAPFDGLIEYTPFASQFRYDAMLDDTEHIDRRSAHAAVEAAVAHVEAIVARLG